MASSSVGISKVQRRLSLALDDAQIARLRQLRPAADWVRLRNCGGDWASLWLSVPPAEHGLSLLDVEYAAMVRWRLRLPLRAGMCALCERAFDAFGDHAQSCPRGPQAWNPRHHTLQNAVRLALRWAGLTVSHGQAVPGLPHIPDLTAEAFWIPDTHVEVTVRHPHATSGARRLPEWGSAEAAFVEDMWRGRLDRDYGGGPPGDAPYVLMPAAVSTFGAWHPTFVSWIRRFLRDRVGAVACSEVEANGLLGGML